MAAALAVPPPGACRAAHRRRGRVSRGRARRWRRRRTVGGSLQLGPGPAAGTRGRPGSVAEWGPWHAASPTASLPRSRVPRPCASTRQCPDSDAGSGSPVRMPGRGQNHDDHMGQVRAEAQDSDPTRSPHNHCITA